MHRMMLLCGVLAVASSACGEGRGPPGGGTPTGRNNCGNGRLDPGETCDRAITNTSSVGACPTSCDDGIACTADRLLGSADACNAQCSHTPITQCISDDGCCPAGCDGARDNDCSLTCGDGVVDARETCDGNCPASCDDGSACTLDTAYGSAATCSLTCGYQLISGCMNGDGCCPAGCSSANDDDCSTTCGDGVVDARETCDGNCPTSCDDGDACTIDKIVGSAANCNATCTYQAITACRHGDGCCPAGCTPQNDSDCSATCGNGVVDPGETCDGNCPTTCDDRNACTTDALIGSASSCTAACRHTPITACASGDGCCPAGCSAANDSDCGPSTTGRVGDPCANASECQAITSGSPTCLVSGWPSGYCSTYCTSEPCPSGSRCDLELYLCIRECSGPSDCRSGYQCQESYDTLERPFMGCLP